jgi:murein DD-endopeptidase MepM/ murein hydrolase activator NlpD
MKKAALVTALLLAAVSALPLAGCEADRAAPVHLFGGTVDAAPGAGAIMVRGTDTVWNIAERYRLPMRGIIDLNNLAPPYHLQDGQRLLLPPPLEHKVGAGDTVTGIARLYGVSAAQLAQLNNLSAPYALREGQSLRLPETYHKRLDSTPVTAQAVVKPAASPHRTNAMAKKQKNGLLPAETRTQRTASKTTVAPPVRGEFVWPVRGKVISTYGEKPGHLYNDGINIAAPKGAPVVAASDGTVAYVGNDLAGYGNLVLIRHANGIVTAYAHMNGMNVARGQAVRKGQAIGTVGSTGTVASSQLHFEVRRGMNSIDPAKYLGSA